ncbi:hypothetical protein [Marinobacter sp.]|uniref:hypothetical protein n=1 Tax=Marinobacter sp. TaxID=50741 RepID=UPI0026259C52|nr:hypothetical protein [Marinobacter sp.]
MKYLFFTALLSGTVLIMGCGNSMESEAPNLVMSMDLSEIQVERSGCKVRGRDGELLSFEKASGQALIPKGSTITGECFMVSTDER